ncbi:hypothetical protein FQR65_LT04715 [Abscondita terminalis]|nr:hypothetical protein FQR65_LT04715 [Abscondita terminalis]
MSHLIRKLVTTENAPKPVAPYSQAVIWDRTLYVSGVLGLDKDTMKMVAGGAVAEARQALINLGNVLAAGDSGYDKVIKTTILLQDITDFAAVNEVYKEFFPIDYPARTAYEVANLPLNAKVEIEVIAGTGDVSTMHKCHKLEEEGCNISKFRRRSRVQRPQIPSNADSSKSDGFYFETNGRASGVLD